MNGREQLVVFAGSQMTGVDPENGRVLWAHPHDPGNDFNFSLPLFGSDNVLFMSSGYRAGSRAIRLVPEGKLDQRARSSGSTAASASCSSTRSGSAITSTARAATWDRRS